jgi:hypothetical protein
MPTRYTSTALQRGIQMSQAFCAANGVAHLTAILDHFSCFATDQHQQQQSSHLVHIVVEQCLALLG